LRGNPCTRLLLLLLLATRPRDSQFLYGWNS
jgi:hypothetical protein